MLSIFLKFQCLRPGPFCTLFVIRFPVYDPIPPVNLLQQHHTHQLVRKCHLRKAQQFIRILQDIRIKSDRAANNKNDMTFSFDSQSIQLFGKRFGGHLFSLDCQSDHIGILPEILRQPLSFFPADQFFFPFTCMVRCFFISNLYDLQLAIPAQTFAVLLNGPGKIFLFYFSYC